MEGNATLSEATETASESQHAFSDLSSQSFENFVLKQQPTISEVTLNAVTSARRRRIWTRNWIRTHFNQFQEKDPTEIQENEIYNYNEFFHMTEKQFRILVDKLSPHFINLLPVRKMKVIGAEERLAITLKYLATGEFHSCLSYGFKAKKEIIFDMISKICFIIYEQFKDEYLTLPKNDKEWQHIAECMQNKNSIANCYGSLLMQQIEHEICANQSILSVIIDANNNILYADVEKPQTDDLHNIFELSTIKQSIEDRKLNLPTSTYDDQLNMNEAGFLVGDTLLPVKVYLMNTTMPLSGFRKKLWNGQQTFYSSLLEPIHMQAQSSLTILCNMFNVLGTKLKLNDKNTRNVLLGAITLYNFLRKTNIEYCKFIDGIIEEAKHASSDQDSDTSNVEVPHMIETNCLKSLQKQKGDTMAGEDKRRNLVQHVNLNIKFLNGNIVNNIN